MSILQLLENTKFPKNKRTNISTESQRCFVLGDVNYRGQAYLQGRTKGPSRYNKKFPELFSELQKLIKNHDPDFTYTTIQLNKNIESAPHIDKNNVGDSYIIGLGDYTGGDLVVEGVRHNIKDKFFRFNGTKGHWNDTFKGTRYSIIFFTHTFKPPAYHLRFVKIKKEGYYFKEKLVKAYLTL